MELPKKYNRYTKKELLFQLEMLHRILNKLAPEEKIEEIRAGFIEYNKQCIKCKQILPYSEEYFFWKDEKNRILKNCCKDCSIGYKNEMDRKIADRIFRENF